jgi:hypothetical protein
VLSCIISLSMAIATICVDTYLDRQSLFADKSVLPLRFPLSKFATSRPEADSKTRPSHAKVIYNVVLRIGRSVADPAGRVRPCHSFAI